MNRNRAHNRPNGHHQDMQKKAKVCAGIDCLFTYCDCAECEAYLREMDVELMKEIAQEAIIGDQSNGVATERNLNEQVIDISGNGECD